MSDEHHNDSGLEQFCDELDKLVKRYSFEAEMTYAEIVGALHMKAFLLMQRVQREHEGEDEGEDDC
jgi:hypothetical protein